MKIESMRVKNYRTLQDISVTFHGFYTAISGQSNAGKTSLIKSIRRTFKENYRERFFFVKENDVVYRDDKTQWVSGTPHITFEYDLSVKRDDDPGLFRFLEKFIQKELSGSASVLKIQIDHHQNDETSCNARVDGKGLSSYDSREILQKLESSNIAFKHDSADHTAPIFIARGRFLHEIMFSSDEIQQLSVEQQKLQRKLKSISKVHKSELSELLGHLEDKYEVEFTIPDGVFSGTLPFSINLRDKNVDVPLSDWGSGTKNRTQ